MSLEDSLVSCDVLKVFYLLDLRVCSVCGSSISHGVPSLLRMVGGTLVSSPRAPRSTPGLAS